MAAPTFQAAGTVVASAGSAAVSWPAHQADDIGVLIIEYDPNGGTDPSGLTGWTQFTGSPIKTGNVTDSTALSVWWRRAAGSSEGSVTVPDAGNHFVARIVTIRGCATSGDPFNVVSSGAFNDTSDTSQSVPGATTTVADCLVLLLCANGANFASNTWSSLTNSDLSSLTDQASFHDTIINGGGSLVATGLKASAGAYGTTTVTSQRSSPEASISIAFKAPGGAVLTADSGSYAVTGTAADAGDIIMPAASGSYEINGTAATTFKSIILAAATGVYAIAGNDIGFGEFAQWMPMSVSEVDTGSDSASPFMPVCATQGDYQLFIVETDDVAVTLTTANGFSEHPGSPVSVPNADSTIRTRLTVFERIFNGTDGAPIVDATGSDHIIGRSLTFRARLDRNLGWLDLAAARSAVSGTGWAVVSEATEDTSGSWGSVITDTPDQLIIGIVAAAKPSSGNTNLSAITNANLTNIIERVDFARVGGGVGNGGGLGVFTGEFAETGERPDPQPDVPIGTTTFTWGTPAYKATLLIALRPGSRDATPHLKANCEGANGGSIFFSFYFISGGPATLRVGFPVDSGVYGVTGSDATLIPPAGGATLTADPGVYAVAGTVADFDIALLITSGEGAIGEYTYTGASGGNEVTFHDPNRLPGGAESGVYTYAGAGGPDETVLDGPDGPGGPDNRTWLGQDGDARHWRFYGRYRRGRRTGTIH